jgi:hypothetical protein
MAKTSKQSRKKVDPAWIEAVMRMLPREALLEIRNTPPPTPKTRTGRPISRSIEGQRFGAWLVGPRADKPGRVVLCDCGNVSAVEKTNLVRRQSLPMPGLRPQRGDAAPQVRQKVTRYLFGWDAPGGGGGVGDVSSVRIIRTASTRKTAPIPNGTSIVVPRLSTLGTLSLSAIGGLLRRVTLVFRASSYSTGRVSPGALVLCAWASPT